MLIVSTTFYSLFTSSDSSPDVDGDAEDADNEKGRYERSDDETDSSTDGLDEEDVDSEDCRTYMAFYRKALQMSKNSKPLTFTCSATCRKLIFGYADLEGGNDVSSSGDTNDEDAEIETLSDHRAATGDFQDHVVSHEVIEEAEEPGSGGDQGDIDGDESYDGDIFTRAKKAKSRYVDKENCTNYRI